MKQLFFCFGLAKAGTTFLQRTLDSHPEVSCPSEHSFKFLGDELVNLFKSYNSYLNVVDRRTGGQGATFVNSKTVKKVFRYSIEAIIEESAKGKPIAGVNDNSIIFNLQTYYSIFNRPKMIAIFRNPIDRAISTWHHNMRLAEEENDDGHKELMLKHGGFDDWMRLCAKGFNRYVVNCKKFCDENSNMLIIRYEDLIRGQETLNQIFAFLGAGTDREVIEKVDAENTFERMRKNSPVPGFFRKASTSMGEGEISDELREELLKIAAPGLKALGYL